MNLHGIVAGAVGSVNPLVPITVTPRAGYTTLQNGRRVPTAGTTQTFMAQIQPLQTKDIQFLDGLQIQGLSRKLYITGDIEGIVRVDQKDGDLVTFPDGSTWRASVVLEKWPDWVSVAVTLQNTNTALQ